MQKVVKEQNSSIENYQEGEYLRIFVFKVNRTIHKDISSIKQNKSKQTKTTNNSIWHSMDKT